MVNAQRWAALTAIAAIAPVLSAISLTANPAVAVPHASGKPNPVRCLSPDETSSPASTTRASWQTCTSAAGRFSITMPSQAQPSVKPLTLPTGIADMHLLTWTSESEAYFVAYNDYPEELVENADLGAIATILERVPTFFIEGAGATLIGARPISLHGHPGQAFQFRFLSGMTGKGRAYWVGNRLYQLVAASSDADDVDTFLNSFRLLDAD